ncbi:MAG: hypothetical protein V4721_10295 [Bacteroidota bacterium]
MTKISFIVPDVHQAYAGQLLDTVFEPLPIQKILGEMIKIAENGNIPDSDTLHIHITEKFGITHVNYRACIKKLTDKKIIRRESNTIILCESAAVKFEQFNTKEHAFSLTESLVAVPRNK